MNFKKTTATQAERRDRHEEHFMVLGSGPVQVTLRLLEVKGLTISGGMSRPGGHGREKLLSRYLPLIASSTSLPFNA